MSTTPTATETQVGGTHYRDLAIQPSEFIHRNRLSFLEGCIVKRICRWRKKDGIKDLLKIKHEIDLIIEFEGLRDGARRLEDALLDMPPVFSPRNIVEPIPSGVFPGPCPATCFPGATYVGPGGSVTVGSSSCGQ